MAEHAAIHPDHAGAHYHGVLQTLHRVLRPKTYFEIGTLHGDTLAFAACPALAVDPCFMFLDIALVTRIIAKPRTLLFQTTSDDFFADNDPVALLGGRIEMAFLDGMHRCEFLLRDFINTERHCKRNSVIALHDCLPVEPQMAERSPSEKPPLAPHRLGWWTGDVWRTALLLKRHRPDLVIIALDAGATGLVLVTNLDPTSTSLADTYQDNVAAMFSWTLEAIGIGPFMAEMEVESTTNFATDEQINRRLWL